MNGCFGNYNEEQYKENKVMGYYYNKLIKKVLVILRFNMFMERSRFYDNDIRHDKQCDNEYNDKIYNFFHNENDITNNNNDNNNNYKQYVEMFEHNNINNYNNNNKHLNISSTSSSIDKAQQSPIKEECESVTQVNELIDHLEYRYKQLLRKTKATKQQQVLTTNNSVINSNNNSNKMSSQVKRSSISMKVSPTKINRYIKAKQYCTKVNNKNIKRNSKNYTSKTHSKQICITCPYCVSNIKHNKCIVNGNKHQKQLPNQSQFDPNLLLGAPSFSKNTFNFIHKNL